MRWVFLVKRELSVLFYEFITLAQPIKESKKVLGISQGFNHYRSVENRVELTYEEREVVRKFFLSKISKKGFPTLKKLINKWNSFIIDAIKTSEEISKQDFSKKSDKWLIKDLKKLKSAFYSLSTSLNLPLVFGEVLEKSVQDYLDKKEADKDKVREYYQILTYPEDYTESTKELISILNIVIKIQDNKLKLNKDDQLLGKEIGKHITKFGYMNTRGLIGNQWTFDDVYARIEDLLKKDCKKELFELEQGYSSIENKTKEVLTAIKSDSEFKELVGITQALVKLRTDRMDSFVKTGFIARPLFNEIAKRLSLTLDELFCMTSFEIEDALMNKKAYSRLIDERKKAFGFININGKITLISGADLEKFKKENMEEDITQVSEFKGQIAYSGKAKGIVKIIHSKKEISKINIGDILVASMTLPDFVSGMQKAAAFVTDEGGVLCHAAIIAREMKKPCIIGTKIATKVLKDGDIVEVDAEKGVVRKIR